MLVRRYCPPAEAWCTCIGEYADELLESSGGGPLEEYADDG
eukprot:CAMPEP_0171673638 /NCGR_PEP_ID=MMETSP0990-20121206/52712_1 /TAXON_ID=483369 /ORGANISM="non described non described, Strain CCMP2098" /LENGTH=40 /DNA_ID= /DNA_START= /DNA_END= /DNA_ORIENTATION=